AELHLRMNRLEDALELAARARAAGLVVNSQRVLGLVYFRKKDLDKAVFHLERAPGDAEVLASLIQTCLLLGDVARAERHYAAAQSLDGGKDAPALHQAMQQVEALLASREQLWKELNLREGKKTEASPAL